LNKTKREEYPDLQTLQVRSAWRCATK
jgi:uncharacterized protein (DUF433 family)